MERKKLTHKQEAVAQLLATGGIEKQEIAKQVGISRTMLWRYEQDENFKARVQELKSEFESFASDLIHSKLTSAVNDYWKLIKDTDNARVKADGYKFFIERSLGKTPSKLELTANTEEIINVDNDLLTTEYDGVIEVEFEDVSDSE